MSRNLIKKPAARAIVFAGLFVAAMWLAAQAWDLIGYLNVESVSAPDGGAGYTDSGNTNFGRPSPGYSTGPDDKNYLRLPGVPDYPGAYRGSR
jgi:hypothetical protein